MMFYFCRLEEGKKERSNFTRTEEEGIG